jgi:hypothetical protein
MDSIVFRLLSILIVLPIARMDREVFRHADFARRLRSADLQLFIGTLAIIHIFDCAGAGFGVELSRVEPTLPEQSSFLTSLQNESKSKCS